MRADKQCKNCEWWDINGPLFGGRQHRCLRWPGRPWLVTYGTDRCWQHVKRTKETEESVLDPRPGVMVRTHGVPSGNDDLRDAARLVLEAGLATGHADTCTDLVSEVLEQVRGLQECLQRCMRRKAELTQRTTHLNLRLQLARELIEKADKPIVDWPDWSKKADSWLQSE